MRKAIRRLVMTSFILILLFGGAAWWLLSYIAPDEKLDMAYEPIDVQEKALAMVRNMQPELVLTEEDVNDLIKMHLLRRNPGGAEKAQAIELAPDVRLDGAVFELEEGTLTAKMNVTYKEQIHAELQAVYALEWQLSAIALSPRSLSVKDIGLPRSLLEPIVIPLELPAHDVVAVRDVQFGQDRIVVHFKIDIQLR